MSAFYITIYFVCWASFHSFLAGRRAKRLAARWFGPEARRWYRLGFVCTALCTLTPLIVLLVHLPDIPLYAAVSPWRWLMVGGQIVSLILLAWTIQSTDPLDFIGIRQLSRAELIHSTTLTTRGLYRFSRHPMYFASMLVMWLSPTMSLNRLTLFALMSLYFIVGSYHEEKLLTRQFGSDYLEYRKKVPRIVPGLPFPP